MIYAKHHAEQKENRTEHLEHMFKDRIRNESVFVIVTYNHIIDLFHKMIHGIDSNTSITTINVN